jgi:hypothetical protein
MGQSVYPAPAGAGPLDKTWTTVGYVNPHGTTTQTITGLGGYKYLRIMSSNVWSSVTGDGSFTVRFNDDSTTAAYAFMFQQQLGSAGGVSGANGWNTFLQMYPLGSDSGQSSFVIEIENPTSTTSKKLGTFMNQGFNNSSWFNRQGYFIWSNTAAITSVTIANENGNNFNTSGQVTDGFHIFGAN